ncbi:MAG: hypothetical protein PVG93_04340 [Phycisphaerales bacterium]|jgi:hypothetical protein
MQIRKIIFYLLAVILGGCVPVASLYPLYEADDILFDEKLLGTWVGDSNGTWQFARQQNEPNSYRLTLYDDQGKKGLFKANLVRVSNKFFLDAQPLEFPCNIEDANCTHWYYNAFFMVPMHSFLAVDSIEPELKMRLLYEDKVEKLLQREPKAISYVSVDDRIVLNAPPKELQAFLLKHVDDEEFFDETMTLRREKVPEPPQCGTKDPDEQPSQK